MVIPLYKSRQQQALKDLWDAQRRGSSEPSRSPIQQEIEALRASIALQNDLIRELGKGINAFAAYVDEQTRGYEEKERKVTYTTRSR